MPSGAGRATFRLPPEGGPVMPITFEPLHSIFVAEVRGFDMRQPIDAVTAREFERAIDRFAVLVFPAQSVDDAQQLAFTANFGPPDIGRKKAVKIRR